MKNAVRKKPRPTILRLIRMAMTRENTMHSGVFSRVSYTTWRKVGTKLMS